MLRLLSFGAVLASLISIRAARADDAAPPAAAADDDDEDAKPLVVAEPAPAPPPAPARVAVAPPRAPAPPPPPPQRWYGWQALIAHGLTDTLLVTAIAVADTSEDVALGLTVAGLVGRPVGSFVVEVVHDGQYVLAPIGSFLLPAMGAGGGIGIAEELGKDGDDVVIIRALAGGMIVGGSVMAALEASFAFEDAPAVKVGLGPGTLTLGGRF